MADTQLTPTKRNSTHSLGGQPDPLSLLSHPTTITQNPGSTTAQEEGFRIPERTAFQHKLNLNDEPIHSAELQNVHSQQTPVHQHNQVPRKHPSPHHVNIAQLTQEHFGPEVLAASTEQQRHSTGPATRNSRLTDKGHSRQTSQPQHQPFPPQGDQYANFNFTQPFYQQVLPP